MNMMFWEEEDSISALDLTVSDLVDLSLALMSRINYVKDFIDVLDLDTDTDSSLYDAYKKELVRLEILYKKVGQ